MKHTLFITGAAGYIGFMLVEQFALRDDVERIIALDKEEAPESFARNPKIRYIQKNDDDAWETEVSKYVPDIVIHSAWQIRDMYGQSKTQHQWNIEGSDRVFDFAFRTASVKRLIHFSTVASYGAFADNMIEHRFTENEPFRKSEYRYAEEKRITEEHLAQKYAAAHRADIAVAIVRPAAITGPRGRFARIRFGLQSALSGQLSGSFIYSIVTTLTSFVPATPKWVRQYVHEDDVVDIVELLSFSPEVSGYEAYNLCPPGEPVLAQDMARAVGKRTMPMPPFLIRIAFFFTWHLSRGRIPTSGGSWRGYSFPIVVDGSKITKKFGYAYRMPSKEAFIYTDGRYESSVPEPLQRKRPPSQNS